MADQVCFHLDPRCPWCWQTSKWVRQLARLNVVEASWGVFCLEVVNFKKPVEQFDVRRSQAAPALRTLVMVREAEGQQAAGRFYEAVGTRYFEGEEPLDAPETVRGALSDVGLDPAWHDKAVTDAWTWKTVMEEHQSLVRDTRSFGVPTIRLDGGYGNAIFGPVISNPPASDDEAVELWTHVSWLARYDNFSELKRDRTIDPDLNYWRTFQQRRQAEAAQIADTAARAAAQADGEAAARATGVAQ
jgi:predicted DsbA family dithiol-disulfide isomerase